MTWNNFFWQKNKKSNSNQCSKHQVLSLQTPVEVKEYNLWLYLRVNWTQWMLLLTFWKAYSELTKIHVGLLAWQWSILSSQERSIQAILSPSGVSQITIQAVEILTLRVKGHHQAKTLRTRKQVVVPVKFYIPNHYNRLHSTNKTLVAEHFRNRNCNKISLDSIIYKMRASRCINKMYSTISSSLIGLQSLVYQMNISKVLCLEGLTKFFQWPESSFFNSFTSRTRLYFDSKFKKRWCSNSTNSNNSWCGNSNNNNKWWWAKE